jgi:hypothetical protein
VDKNHFWRQRVRQRWSQLFSRKQHGRELSHRHSIRCWSDFHRESKRGIINVQLHDNIYEFFFRRVRRKWQRRGERRERVRLDGHEQRVVDKNHIRRKRLGQRLGWLFRCF